MPRGIRVGTSVAVGLIAGMLAWYSASVEPWPRDLMQIWVAARGLLHGQDPYSLVGPGRALEFHAPLLYPLSAAVAVLPLAFLSSAVAVGIFVGIGISAFAWTLMSSGYAPLLAFLTVCPWQAVYHAQWSPLMAGAIGVPLLGALLVAKPTVGAAIFVARPSRVAVVGGLLLLAMSFALDPHWLSAWRNAVESTATFAVSGDKYPYRPPVFLPGGFLVLLGLTRWRRWEARLLIAMACAPQTLLPYEALPLFLIPRGWKQCSLFAALAYGMTWYARRDDPATLLATVRAFGPAMTLWLYLPATLMVLRRSNEGMLPAWLERSVARWPLWLRGYPNAARG